jgi:hypothetical protein
MSTLPPRFAALIVAFSRLFRQQTWRHAERLLLGAILAPGIRTVTQVLRVLGLAHERHFVNYHRVLSRAAWSPRAASRILLGLLVRAFVPTGPIVLGLDETLERRRGARIRAKGVYRDSVQASHSHFVKATGLRWLSVMLLAPIPWARRIWALPVLTALAPSPRYAAERGVRHKALTAWGRQLICQVHRWLPGRALIVVADASFAALDFFYTLAVKLTGITCITRVRLNTRLYTFPPPRRRPARGRRRRKGRRLPAFARVLARPSTGWTRLRVPGWYGQMPGQTRRTIEVTSGTALWYGHGLLVPVRWVLVRDPRQRLDPQAFLATDLALTPSAIVQYYVQRWQLEVTFEEARRHLGLETQRQWSDRAIARTTPILLSLFSVVTLCATRLVRAGTIPLHATAWYQKLSPTFSDALAAVRAACWATWWRRSHFHRSLFPPHTPKSTRRFVAHLTTILCEAA